MNLVLASKHALSTLLLLSVAACGGGGANDRKPPTESGPATLTVNVFQILAYDPDLAFGQWDALPSGGATLAMTSVDGQELSSSDVIRLSSGLHEVGYRYDVTLSCDANGNCDTRTGYGTLDAMFAADGRYRLKLACNVGALLVVITNDQDEDSRAVAEGEALEDYGICDDLTTQLG